MRMIVNQRWGFSAAVALVVGVGIGVLIAVLAGRGSGPRVVISVGIGLIIGGALLAIFDRLIVRRVLDAALPAFDSQTGEPLPSTPPSSFFGRSLELWTLVLVGAGGMAVGVGVVLYVAG